MEKAYKGHNLNLNSALSSDDQAKITSTNQEFALEMGLKDGLEAPSVGDGDSEQGTNTMDDNWDGKKETYNMFLRSYE